MTGSTAYKPILFESRNIYHENEDKRPDNQRHTDDTCLGVFCIIYINYNRSYFSFHFVMAQFVCYGLGSNKTMQNVLEWIIFTNFGKDLCFDNQYANENVDSCIAVVHYKPVTQIFNVIIYQP